MYLSNQGTGCVFFLISVVMRICCIKSIKRRMKLLNSCLFVSHTEGCYWNSTMDTCWEVIWVLRKTTESVLCRFYCPGVQQDIENYCQSCPKCQMLAPLPYFWSPLVPLPIIKVPFERIAIEFLGLLPKLAQCHQHILVIMDYAIFYPYATHLPKSCSWCSVALRSLQTKAFHSCHK